MKTPEGYYAVLFKEPKSKTIGVRFRDFPGIVTYGMDIEHAEEMAKEALNGVLEVDFDRSAKLPQPSRKPKAKKGERVVLVRLDPEVRMAYILRRWRERAKLTQKQMAAKLEITYQAYQRMERPGRSNLTVATLEKIAESLNRRLVIDLQ